MQKSGPGYRRLRLIDHAFRFLPELSEVTRSHNTEESQSSNVNVCKNQFSWYNIKQVVTINLKLCISNCCYLIGTAVSQFIIFLFTFSGNKCAGLSGRIYVFALSHTNFFGIARSISLIDKPRCHNHNHFDKSEWLILDYFFTGLSIKLCSLYPKLGPPAAPNFGVLSQ